MSSKQKNCFDELNDSLQNLAKFLPGHIYWKDRKGKFIGCNETQAKSAGLTIAEMLGKTDYDMPWKAQADNLRNFDEQVMQAGIPKTTEEASILENGELRIFLSSKVPLMDQSNKCIGLLGISLDITEQKKREQELVKQVDETKMTLNTIMENIPAHIFWKDNNCRLLGCNTLQAQNMGYTSPKAMIGKSNYELINQNQPESKIKEQAEALDKSDLEVIKNGHTITSEETLFFPDGKKFVYLSKKTPLYDKSNKIIGLVGISFDITKEKAAEELEIQYKLDGMTAVSASIAHELRTPLAALEIATGKMEDILPDLIKSYKISNQYDLPEMPKISEKQLNFMIGVLEFIRGEIRSSFLFIEMMLYKLSSSVSAKGIDFFSISDCLKEVMQRYPFQEEETKLVTLKIKNDFTVSASKISVVHVFFNLLKNSLYHIAKAGKGDISIYGFEGANYNKVIFKDTGSGMPKHLLKKIFDRFFSQTQHGSGVGLTYCYEVMRSLGGDISCNSQEGQYTKFILSFPKLVKPNGSKQP